jgi:hypothetical protein
MQFSNTKGENHPNAKLSVSDIEAIRSSPLSSTELVEVYKVSSGHIRKIKRKAVWKKPLEELKK